MTVDYSQRFGDRSVDIPQRVHGFLRTCELACVWQVEHKDTMEAWFCSGVVDYWWDDTLEKPTFKQLFYVPLNEEDEWAGFPSKDRFAYQQGAIIGYRLRRKYG